ncbi:MAG TPA: ECF-type sigma factor [Gemmataceae bacterium]|nr:ECF-type sigma factor [Gemmataceae bacterium]
MARKEKGDAVADDGYRHDDRRPTYSGNRSGEVQVCGLRRSRGRPADRPAVVIIEESSAAGWVRDLCGERGVPCQVANTGAEGWKYKHAKWKTDRDDALRLAQLYALGQLPEVIVPAKRGPEVRVAGEMLPRRGGRAEVAPVSRHGGSLRTVPGSGSLRTMSDVTRLLEAAAAGDPRAAVELLPLVYEELRKLAATHMAHEKPGQTLQTTALVHEAYLRLVPGRGDEPGGGRAFANRRHFFAAAGQAMRHILVEIARRKAAHKRGGGRARADVDVAGLVAPEQAEELLAVHEALDALAATDPQAAELVTLRYFVGLSIPEAAEVLGIGARSADRLWSFARAWLRRAIAHADPTS